MMSPTVPNPNTGASENCLTAQPLQEAQAPGIHIYIKICLNFRSVMYLYVKITEYQKCFFLEISEVSSRCKNASFENKPG